MSSASRSAQAQKAKATERMHYVQGYVPVSYAAAHSSLSRASTWVGMALLLSALAGIGTMIFAAGSATVGSQEHWVTYMWIGAVMTVIMLVGGAYGIIHGRREFHRYARETGRSQ
ncbi:hypothetical protein [Corynebacterium pacaense]|uniref:hypothetical protein n=1 Tax=Corynebacterium pacaense TaxID=1816684 RepID=UPI0009BC1768|nr:hypothetical protein [Corynebacterium pacaense]